MKQHLVFARDYSPLSDRALVEQVTNPAAGTAPNGEAVAYLLYERYHPLLKSIYNDIFGKKGDYYDDCLGDLYNYLHGQDEAWNKLKNFAWRSEFSTWLRPTARNRFIEKKHYLIGKFQNALSIDDDEAGTPKVQIPDEGLWTYERNEIRVLMMEAIMRLPKDDERFVIIKKLEGYSSKEVAELLKMRWEKYGIIKYGYKAVEGQAHRQRVVVVPDEAYVDSLMQHARNKLKKILNQIM